MSLSITFDLNNNNNNFNFFNLLIFRKNALTELAVQWNPASEEFVQIGLRMESCTDIIQPCEEYNDYTKKLVPTQLNNKYR